MGQSCLVATEMRCQIPLRCAGVPRDKAKHLVFHVRQRMPTFLQRLVLAGAVQVHNGVDGLKNVFSKVCGHMVDFINY